MTNRVLWLLSYIGLSLALSLGNNRLQQTTSVIGAGGAVPIATGASSSLSALSSPQGGDPVEQQHHRRRRGTSDWTLYNKRSSSAGGNGPVLLDEVMSAVLGNYYRQRQSHSDRKPPTPSTSYLYRDDQDDDEDNEVQDDDDKRESQPGDVDFLDQRYGLASKPDPPPPRPPGKRNHSPGRDNKQQLSPPVAAALASAGTNMASQFMLRSARGSRQYDVPQIECPLSDDGMERFACPTADRMGRYRCIDDHVLCDGFIDCPTGEDEDRQACMFYKTTKAHLDVLADALLRWARGR